MPPIRPLLAALIVALLSGAVAAPAQAQNTISRSVTVPAGKSVRLAIAPNLKRDCSAGPMPEVKVTSPPKNGSLITRSGKLTTPAKYRCPSKEANVQGVFYQPNARFTGADEVAFEIKTTDGATDAFTIKITVGGAAPAKPDATDL